MERRTAYEKNSKKGLTSREECAIIYLVAEATKYLGVAQLGSVLEWGSRGRKFESSHPDHSKSPEITMVSGLFSYSFT